MEQVSAMAEAGWSACLADLHGLGSGQALAFCARPEDFASEVAVAVLEAALSTSERARMGRFRFPADQHIYLVAHGLLRLSLSARLGMPAPDIAFETTERGRPQLAACHSASGVHFNISHTKGLVACAFALGADVGVDVEDVHRRADMAALATSVLSAAERRALWELPDGAAQQARFFELWTLKESYIKAVGQGLGLPLQAISFHFPGPPPVASATVTFEPQIDDDPRRLHYVCRPVLAHHQFALAYPAAFARSATLRLLRSSSAAELAQAARD